MKKWLRRIALLSAALLLLLIGAGAYLVHLISTRSPGQFFDSNGFKIYYTEEGKGEPVILVHGLGANADLNWRRAGITEELARDHRVVAMDIRGHGLSQHSHESSDYGIELVNDVLRLMDHLNIPKAHVAGYSLGGFIALKFVAEHPDRVLSAAYCASGWKDPDGPEDILSPYRRPVKPQAALEDFELLFPHGKALTFDDHRILSAATDRFLSGPVDWMRDYIGKTVIDRQSVKAMKKSLRGLIVTREQLQQMKTPGICFIGTNDGLYPYADDLHKVQPAIELVVLEGANHITTAINSEFQQKLRAFFEQHHSPAETAGQ